MHTEQGPFRRPLSLLFVFAYLKLRFVNPFSRAGTNVDCENLSNTLRNLHFDVSIYKDFKHNEIMHEIEGGELRGNFTIDHHVLI